MGTEDDRYYTAAEVARLLRVDTRTVTRAIAAGALRAIKMGDRAGWRIGQHDLDAWLDSRANRPAQPKGTSR
jgi:excisionase family DNA binding protein